MQPTPNPEAAMSQPLSILIAEDVGMAGELLRVIAEKAGASVAAMVADGERAVEAFREHHPDIVLLDMFMPKKNGLQVLSEIRELDPEAFIVLISAEAPMSRIKQAHELGAQAFLVKPVRLSQVQALMDKCRRIQPAARGRSRP